ncbi:MAG: phosphoglycerate kinase [Dehalococcoidia bacterium]|nr:phosphoglycerate kinase [Dehalococcoidia bacterium]
MKKKTVRDIAPEGKRVLVRVDFNVPMVPGSGEISDDSRIRASLPTIKYLLDRRAKVILSSHLGRPDGKIVEEMRLAPVARRLSELLGRPVRTASDSIGPEAEKAVSAMNEGDVLLLENLRFHPEEEKNDAEFARALAGLADLYVNDAFGTAHRAHASTTGVTRYLPAVAGFLMEKELEFLGRALSEPARPFASIVGGAKVGDKMKLLENILKKVDCLLIGGGMCSTFLKALSYEVGKSTVEEDKLEFARGLIDKSKRTGVKLVLPSDLVVADRFDREAAARTVSVADIPKSWYVMDIGPQTVKDFAAELRKCRTVVWNGPMGVFEFNKFRSGTESIARELADLNATTIIGGGSTAQAVEELGLAERMSHVSTGGGASLEFLEGKTLPGVAALNDKD